jgi:uncharacterized protein
MMRTTKTAPSLEELRVRRDEIYRISSARGARNIRVFGSVARRESRPESDVELLVEMDRDRTVLDLSELILDLEEALDRTVDVVEIRRDSPVGERILQEAVPLLRENLAESG